VTLGADPAASPATVPIGRTDPLGRAFDLYRRTTRSRTAVLLVAANAVPLAGVLFFGWSLWTILVLYWVENGIVGFWTLPRILLAQGTVADDMASAARAGVRRWSGMVAARGGVPAAEREKVAAALQGALDVEISSAPTMPGLLSLGSLLRVPMALFFLFHYGLFWFVHGVFVFVLPTFAAFGSAVSGPLVVEPGSGPPFFPGALEDVVGQSAWGDVVWSSVLLGAAGLFLAHGVSFFVNYLQKGEYLRTSAARAMGQPYGRVVILHVTILFGAFAIALLGAPVAMLLVLVIGKTLLDLSLYLRQHDPAPGTTGAFVT
jgi:hypothetical protein